MALEEITLVRFMKPKMADKHEILSMTDSVKVPYGDSDYEWLVTKGSWHSKVLDERKSKGKTDYTDPELRYVEVAYKDCY
jgi:hypothetical protein